jgi:O-antigen/teichoic acid export membrane protein
MTENQPADLHVAVSESAQWNILSQFLRQALLFGSQVVLARLLFPRDYGVFALCVAVTLFCSHISDVGFAAAVVQRSVLTPRLASGAFWGNLQIGILTSAVVIASAPLLAILLREPALVAPLRALALLIPLQSATSIHRALMIRSFAFPRLAVIDIVAVSVSSAAAIIWAIEFHNVWSLVAAQIAATVCTSAGLIIAYRWHPQFSPRWSHTRPLVPFVSGKLTYESITYWARTLDNLLIGRLFGLSTLGLYSRAFALVQRPAAQLQEGLGGAVLSAFAKAQHDTARLARGYRQLVGPVTVLGFPVLAFAIIVAPDIVALLYGNRWIAVTPYARIFLLAAALQLVMIMMSWLIEALGETRILLLAGVIFSVGNMSGFAVAAALHSSVGYSWSYVGSTIAATIFEAAWLRQRLNIPIISMFAPVARPVIVAILVASASADGVALMGVGDHALRTIVAVGIAVPTYLLAVRLIAPKEGKQLFSAVRMRRQAVEHP